MLPTYLRHTTSKHDIKDRKPSYTFIWTEKPTRKDTIRTIKGCEVLKIRQIISMVGLTDLPWLL